jgi:hypothetical protein
MLPRAGIISVSTVLRPGRRQARVILVLTVLVVAFSTATARLFIFPPQGMPPRVDAVVMLDGPGDVLNVALRLATDHRARFLVVSQGTLASRDPCPQQVHNVTLICFNPIPSTTRGEAEFVGRLAKTFHWHSIAVVAITPQVSRARLRVERCFSGSVYMVSAPMTKSTWPYQIAYEWGSLIKAMVIERSC